MPLAAPLARDLLRHTVTDLEPRAKALPLALGEVNDVLPEGGLPRGGVVEIASPRGLARATSIALAACAGAQAEARLRGGEETEGAWCAWIDPMGSLYAPAVARAGVDLARLLVVRPPICARALCGHPPAQPRSAQEPPSATLARVAVRMATSRAFLVLVIDAVGVPGAWQGEDLARWVNVVRKLALAMEGSDGAVLLLTDRLAARPMPLPVAMRIEVERPAEDRLTIRVAKDRRGRVTAPAPVPLRAEPPKDRSWLRSA
jgi:recombination protein RecA